MSDATVDRLEIQIQAQAQKASTDIDRLIGKLEKMSGSLSSLNTGGLKNLASGVDVLGRSVQNMSTVKTSDFSRVAKNIEKLGSVNQTGITNTANALRTISSALTAIPDVSNGVTQIASLANGISKLGYKTVTTATANLPGLSTGLQQFVSSLSGIENIPDGAQGISDLAGSIAKLGYKSVTNAIANLPMLATSMKEFMTVVSSAPNVSQNIINMTNAMANLASQGSKYNSTIKSMGNAAKNLGKAHNEAHKSNVSFMATLSKIAVGYYILRRALRATFEPIKKAMDLGETVNLFQTSFKKIGMEAAQESGLEWGSAAADAYAKRFIDRAQSFNDRISEALSLDPNVTMNYQAVFAQMANAFGLVTKSVGNLSESFTLLGLDIASFFNVDVEEAMVKLRAGLAGETEPLMISGLTRKRVSNKLKNARKSGVSISELPIAC